jgi:multicomponent Na+:H+ antiporter subunit E
MFSKIILFAVLFLCWFVFSGHSEPLYLAIGALSCLITVVVAAKCKIINVPNVKISIIGYFFWLAGQVIASAWDVTKRVWSPKLHIQPQFVELDNVQNSDIGRTIYGNSITLTPGTVTVDMEKSYLLVHALTEIGADEIKSGTMDKKVRKIC